MSLLIGTIDQEIRTDDKYKISWSDNKLGGSPTWTTSSAQPEAILTCTGCNCHMTFVVQLYCPLSSLPFHRCIYLFVCTSVGCSKYNTWKALRSMLYDKSFAHQKEAATQKKKTKDFDNDMWTDGQDDWGDGCDADDWGDGCDADDWGDGCDADDWGEDEEEDATDRCEDNGSARDKTFSSIVQGASSPSGKESNCDKVLSNKTPLPNSSPSPNSLLDCPNQTAVDQDLSSTLNKMAVDDSITAGDKDGDKTSDGTPAVAEEMSLPTIVDDRFNQLASVLNTKRTQDDSIGDKTTRDPLLLKSYYLSVFDGSYLSHQASDQKHISKLIKDYERMEGRQISDLITDGDKRKGKGGGGGEVYEKSELKHGDKMFHRFLKELQKYPQQCIRYERCGQPLLAGSLNALQSVIPLCTRCGSSRVYELQLVPALIPWLKTVQGSCSNIEFASVLVYTCSQSCCSKDSSDLDLLEEHVIVQYDPDQHLYR